MMATFGIVYFFLILNVIFQIQLTQGIVTTDIQGNGTWKIPYWRTGPIRGICYSPVPKNIIPSETDWLYDSDMFNSDFQALWGIDPSPGVVSRDDLRYLRYAGFNVIHLYDWNPAWYRDHMPFLDYCFELGIGVFIPISNYVLTDGWDQREQIVESIVLSTHNARGQVHPAVFGWVIGNEYDTHQEDGEDHSPSIPVANVIEILMLVARFDPDPWNRRPFTIPCSIAMGYNNNARPGMGQLSELRDEMLKHDISTNIYYNRYMPGLNPFMPFKPGIVEMILNPYKELAESWGETPLPLIFTETGISAGSSDITDTYEPVMGTEGQTFFELQMEKDFVQLVQSGNEYNFSGYFFFEFCQEDWKGEGSPDMLYGLHQLGNNTSPVLPHQKSGFWSEISQVYLTNSQYPVDQLIPTKAWRAIVALQTNPSLLSSESNDSVEIPCVTTPWKLATSGECLLYDDQGCLGFSVYTREIVVQANQNAPSCPTNMSMVVPCRNSGPSCAIFGITEAKLFGILAKGLLCLALLLLMVWCVIKCCFERKIGFHDDEDTDYGSITSLNI